MLAAAAHGVDHDLAGGTTTAPPPAPWVILAVVDPQWAVISALRVMGSALP